MADGLKVAVPVVLTLLFLAIILAVAGTMLLKIQDTQTNEISSRKDNNSINGSGLVSLTHTRILLNTVNVSNVTTLNIHQTGNWSMNATDAANGRINISGPYADKAVNVSYDFTNVTRSLAYNATEDGLVGVDTFSDFQPTIATIAVAIVIILLILGGLGGFLIVGGGAGGFGGSKGEF